MLVQGIPNRIKVWMAAISASYWFLPACMTLIAIGCCFTIMVLFTGYQAPPWLLELVPDINVEGARQLISTIAGAIITATSITFSMTIVALTLASSQFGPRIIRSFLEDRGTQYVLGVMVSTFIFCLLALHYIEMVGNQPLALAGFSTGALLLAIFDIGIIIYFIHHVCTSIQADEVIHRCFRECLDKLPELLPQPVLQSHQRAITPDLISPSSVTKPLCSARSGYLQSIDYDALLARQHPLLVGIEMHVRSGDHVVAGETLITLHLHETCEEDWIKECLLLMTIGTSRTPIQDPEFSIAQLVEIALRALSPGINDPYTAMTCLDRLTAACLHIHEREFPPACILNTDTGVWMKRRCFTFESVLDTAFNQIRQAAESHPALVIHLLKCLNTLHQRIADTHPAWAPDQASALLEQTKNHSFSSMDNAAIAKANFVESTNP